MPGGKGRRTWDFDFLGSNADAASLVPLQCFGVGTETYAATTDEEGGILAFGTGATDNNNAVMRYGPFAPRNGYIVLEARFKYSNVDCAVFVGFAETLDITTPVMPMEFATSTMTYNGTGGMVGFNYDVDGSTDDFRAGMGDGGAAISDSSSGTRVNATLTADQWFEARIILHSDGSAECWFADPSDVDSLNMNKFKLVKRFTTGTLLTNTDLFFACLMIEARTDNARTLETDYFRGSAGVDWRYN